jgi:hypothetical protein
MRDGYGSSFLFQFCDVAKFGYNPGMKVNVLKYPSYFWLHNVEKAGS